MDANSLVVIALCVVSVFAAKFQKDVFTFEQNENAEGVHWALIVAGSNGYYNYRHQADACHAYQILNKNGIPEERIVVMMYDDIAQNPDNPTKGIIINHLNGSDVYHNVPKDYVGKDVTPEVFLKVLQGENPGVGSGKVIASGPNDHVFVNFVDHGAPGILAFPADMLSSKQLMNAIMSMSQKKQYGQMVFYVEACESGSMFANLLPKNINVFATTAANPDESSYACYFDPKRNTYLGDVYSVKWMEDSDKENLRTETLKKQFMIVKKETNTSHVQEYGDLKMSSEDVAEFQGNMMANVKPMPVYYKETPFDAVRSEDVPLMILQNRLANSESRDERIKLTQDIVELEAARQHVRDTFKHIVGLSTSRHTQATRILTIRHPLTKYHCYDPAVQEINRLCFDLPQNDFALRHLYQMVNLCEENVPIKTIMEAMEKVCMQKA